MENFASRVLHERSSGDEGNMDDVTLIADVRINNSGTEGEDDADSQCFDDDE